MYTLQDYEAARAELDSITERWDNYSGNNPEKLRASIAEARAKLHTIEVALKASGALARSDIEQRDHELDIAFPNAQSREVVLWQGKKYMRRFTPVSKSLSGKSVKAWAKTWELVSEQE